MCVNLVAWQVLIKTFFGLWQPSPTPVTVLVQQPVSDSVPSHSLISKPNDVEASHVEEAAKDDEESEENKDQEEKEIDKEDDNGDDDLQSVEEA